jgi:molybdopterin molybdotransferase
MISVEEAQNILLQNVNSLNSFSVELPQALNHVLAEDFTATISLPPFRQSAMDGYAVHFTQEYSNNFNLIGEVSAGSTYNSPLKEGEATRIFTGAAVPEGANAVIMQEWINEENNIVQLNATAGDLRENLNIRPIGEQINTGQTALTKGLKLTAPALGLIQSFGVKEVEVHKKPIVSLVVTGNEIIAPGEELPFGSIYESNSVTLKSALQNAGFEISIIEFKKDNLDHIQTAIANCAAKSDVVLVSGGISVGDYDFVKTAFENIGVNEGFYKIAQKPGKPIYFGNIENKSFFGLPGNPASALVCLYEYVIPVLKKMAGHNHCFPTKTYLPIKDSYHKRGNRAQFLKALILENSVEVLNGQASSMLHTFALSNSLVFIPSNRNKIEANELVEVHLLNS